MSLPIDLLTHVVVQVDLFAFVITDDVPLVMWSIYSHSSSDGSSPFQGKRYRFSPYVVFWCFLNMFTRCDMLFVIKAFLWIIPFVVIFVCRTILRLFFGLSVGNHVVQYFRDRFGTMRLLLVSCRFQIVFRYGCGDDYCSMRWRTNLDEILSFQYW